MLAFINHLLSVIPAPSAPIVAMAALVVEFVLRLIPSQGPLGVLYLVASVLKGVGAIFDKLGALLDKVLPQRLLPPQ